MCAAVVRPDRSQSVRVPLRVLIAEDSENDARLLLRELARGGFDSAYERVDNPAAMQAALDRQAWDLVIGDYSMPAFSGPAALALLRAHDPDTPFIFVSGTIGEDVAVEAMKAGAQDFLTKGNLRRLIPAIQRELRDTEVRRERRRAQTALVERARLAELTSDVGVALTQGTDLRAMLQLCAEALVRHLDVAFARVWTLDDAGAVLELQASAGLYTHIDGAHSRVPLGRYKIGAVAQERRPQLTNQVVGDPQIHDQEWARREGMVAFAGYPLIVHDRVLGVMAMFARHALSEFVPKALGSVASAVAVGIERKRAEEALRRSEAQLRQAQKMEAVGRLAGGIAHDFNNLLTVITSYGDLLFEDLASDDPKREDVDQIRKAADGAAALTRQLLAFSRQQVIEPKVLDLKATVTGAEKLLQRLIGADVQLTTSLAPDLGAVKADHGQLEQLIINLAVNARDAMPGGGRLNITAANMEMDETFVRSHPPARPGRYVTLAVSDTGIGMDEQTKARIFEPFFTTKESGKGTGLGLATVYGIVKQAGGFIWVDSEPGRGTTFNVYLPRIDETPEPVAVRPASTEPPRGTETILVVEDSASVRMVTRQVLERYGYVVLEAPNGDTALRLAAKHHGPIHLLLTDVVMPGLSGRQLAERLTQLRPGIRVLYVSGYADTLEPGVAYLQKPFAPETLARRLRDVMDA
jgi:two-component system, cell cycle sensor histidine kinase and response regulator CckA